MTKNTRPESMASKITLRPYQRAAIDGVYEWFQKATGNPLVVVPTGGGKSVIAACFIQEVLDAFPSERILVVTHVKELIEQNHAALKRLWPEAPTGINSAGIGRRDTRSQILFAGLQSVFRRTAELGHFDLVLVDEAHLIPPTGWGMYQQLLGGLKQVNPQVKMIGLTATPYRTDTGKLDEGDGRLFHGLAYECSIPEMIEDGYLSPVTNQGTKAEISTEGIGIRAGEYKKDELSAAARAEGLVSQSVDEMIVRGMGRESWLVFATSVDHAQDICAELTRRGVSNNAVFGNTPGAARDQLIEDFKAKAFRCMVNVNVLTTGFDVPHIDLIALMRPTQSPGLYVQMVGRGLRIAPGKQDCLVLDFGNNILRHGPIDQVRPKQPGKGEPGDAPMKKCPECQTLAFTATRICSKCGYEWPTPEPDHDVAPDEDSRILAGDKSERFQDWAVERVVYTRHSKPGKPDSMKVTYVCGFRKWISEWVCFEHEGFARVKAEKWWRARMGEEPVPATVTEALARVELDGILEASTLRIDTAGKYPEIKGCLFDDEVLRQGQDQGGHRPNPEVDYGDIPF